MHETKRYDEALEYCERGLSLKPDIDWMQGELLHLKMKLCKWDGFEESLKNLRNKLIEKEKVTSPFPFLALSDDPLLQRQCAEIYINNKYHPNDTLGSIPILPPSPRIRIGYFSADFRRHAVSFLSAELFELHDKDQFEVFAFSFGVDDKSPIRSRLINSFAKFIDVREMTDIEVAILARKLGIDIAVDLGGFTADRRTNIFAYRAAPVQVSYIGYLGTMGAPYFDYLIADKTIIPGGSEQYYSEKIAYLPSYQVNDTQRKISERVFTREELGLPKEGFIFASFNNNFKILPNIFSGWMRILKAVENSILFLYVENPWAQNNLKREANARGIDSDRIVFANHLPTEEYLSRYRICDLFLDTTPYNAGTTASDALWAGLPVLTLLGKSFASRVAASLLNAIEMPELITYSQEQYESLAIELATNSQKLTSIKNKLALNRFNTPLFNTPLFVKNIESAYKKMHNIYESGRNPDHLSS